MGLPALSNGVIVGIGLFLLLLVPYLLWESGEGRPGATRGSRGGSRLATATSDLIQGPGRRRPGASIRRATRGSETSRVDGLSSEAGTRPARLTRD